MNSGESSTLVNDLHFYKLGKRQEGREKRERVEEERKGGRSKDRAGLLPSRCSVSLAAGSDFGLQRDWLPLGKMQIVMLPK